MDDLKAHKSGPFLIADKSVTRLLDEVCYQRTRGRPQRMLPALLALRSRYPEDPRVLYALGEAYGIASPVFDAERAHESFHTLLEALRERSEVATEPVGRGRSLAQFLPELTKAGLLLSERPTDTTARLRQHLLQLCETLQSGRPIGLWKLADPQLDRLYEQLSLARTRLDQERCREVLEAMLDMQPVNAVLRFALAEVYLSLGPAFDRNKAAENLEAFLHLTDPATLGGPDDRRPSVLTSADIVKDLERFRLAKPRSNLEEQRIQAHELLDAIGKTIRKRDDGLLLAPDREAIEKEVSKLEKSIKSKERYLVPALRNVAKFERKASNNRIPANVRVQNRQKAAQWQKKADKLNEEIDGFRARLNELQAVLRR
ncbi:MAG: hypothetical protein KAI24_03930 [Planctomycetes bacterium]|nr:hypothetical protein [Planctomycetota bacterium]